MGVLALVRTRTYFTRTRMQRELQRSTQVQRSTAAGGWYASAYSIYTARVQQWYNTQQYVTGF